MKLIIAILFISFNLSAQEFIPYLKDGKYGYSNVYGKIVIEPKYEAANFFNQDDIAAVKQNGSWLLINKAGKEICISSKSQKPYYATVTNSVENGQLQNSDVDTLENLKIIYLEDRSIRFINIKTFEATRIYSSTEDFRRGLCDLWKNSYKWSYFIGKTNENTYDILDLEGNLIVSTEYEPQIWNENLISYSKNDSSTLFNPKKNIEIRIPYKTVHDNIDNNFFIVSNKEPTKWFYSLSTAKHNYGLIDKDGKVILDTIYQFLSPFGSEYLIARKEYYFLIDYERNPIGTNKYKSILPLSDRAYVATKQNDKKILLDENGDVLKLGEFDNIRYTNSGKYYTWVNEDTSGVLDDKLNEVIKYEAESIYPTSNNKFYHVKRGNLYGIINQNKDIIIPIEYDRCYPSDKEYITIVKNNKKGLATIEGEILFPPEYENIEIKKTGDELFFRPKKNGLYACYDSQLNQIAGFVSKGSYIPSRPVDWHHNNSAYEFTDRFGTPLNFRAKNFYTGYVKSDSTFIVVANDSATLNVLVNGKTLFNNETNKDYEIVAANINSGLFGISYNGLGGVINHKKQVIIPLAQRSINEITDKFIISKEAEKYYLYDFSGKLLHKNGFDYISDTAINGFRVVANEITDKTYEYIQSACLFGKTDTITKYHKNYGYINSEGKITVPLQYSGTSHYRNNVASVSKGYQDGEKKSFLIDTLGNIVLETPYDKLYPFNNNDNSNHYIATLKDKYALISLEGEVIIPFEYTAIQGFCGLDIIMVRDSIHNWHLVNRTNKKLFSGEDLLNDKISDFCINLSGERFLFFPNGGSEIIDLNVNSLLKFSGQEVYLVNLESAKLIEVRENEKKYYINSETLKVYMETNN